MSTVALEIIKDSQGNQLPIFKDMSEYCSLYTHNGIVLRTQALCEDPDAVAAGAEWITSPTPGFRSPLPPYDFIPVPLALSLIHI